MGLDPGEVAANAFVALLYIALNAALNFVNRWALGVHGFRFPLVLTSAHMLLNPVFLAPLMFMAKYREQHSRLLAANWKGILAIAVLNAAQIALNNCSLVHIELSLNQVVRAAMPVVVSAFQWVRVARPPFSQQAVLLLISAGVGLVVYQPSSTETELLGVVLVTSSVTLQAAQMSFAGSLLGGTKLDSFQMTFYTGWPAFATLLPATSHIEGAGFTSFLSSRPGSACAVLIGTCLMAVFYNIVVFQTIHRWNPVGSAVVGNVKVVTLLLLSSVFMGEMRHWTSQQFFGCFLTFGGAAAYSWQKIQAQPSNGETGKKQR